MYICRNKRADKMPKYKKEDFRELPFNPLGVKGDFTVKNIFLTYPDLEKLDSWREEFSYGTLVHRNKLMAYIMYMYQMGSPLLGLNNIVERKVEAGMLAGFERDVDGIDFTEGYRRVMACELGIFNRMVIDFCRLQRNPDFAEYVVYEEIFYKQLDSTIQSDKAEEITRALGNVDKVKRKMAELRKSLLFQDDTRRLVRELMEQVALERVRLRREDIAHALRDGEDPLDGFSVYEAGYTKEFAKDINYEKYLGVKGGGVSDEG